MSVHGQAARPADHEARRTAVTCFDRNLAVLAGAGTGKTSLLVERALNLVGTGHAAMEQIVAITFTQKAAGEMRERMAAGLERLARLARAAPGRLGTEREADRALVHLRDGCGIDPETIAARAVAALGSLDRATVETIHGFCSTLLREHPVEAGVDPAFEVDAGEQFDGVLEEVWEAFLARELGAEAPREELWARLLTRSRFSVDRIRDAARALAAFRIPAELLRPPYPSPDPRELLAARLGRILNGIDEVLRHDDAMTSLMSQRLESVRDLLRRFMDDGLEAMRAAAAPGSDVEQVVRGQKSIGVRTKVDPAVEARIKQVAQDAVRLARLLLRTEDALMRDLVEALGPFALEARETLLRRGYVDFDGLLVLARDLLRDHPAVRESLKRGFKTLLVDEFQDTDPLQYEIVLLLAEVEDGGASDAYEAALAPGRLFIVGDAKQSIYRFRGADTTAFFRATRRLEEQGGVLLDLTTNFRSVPGVLGPINRLFDGSAGGEWQASPYQPEYVAIDAHRAPRGEGPCVEVWTLDVEDRLRAEERRLAEGRIIAETIERLVADGPYGYGNISILLRAFSNLPLYLRPLRARNIPFVVDGGREFLKRPEVGHLIAILRALAQPTNSVALLAYLRSPAAGVPDTELAGWAASEGRWSRDAEPDPQRFPRLVRALAVLRELAADARELPADRLVERVLARTGLPVISGAAYEGAQRVANLRKLAAAAGRLARDGKLSLLEVIDALEQERTADVESDSPLADEGMDAVRVLTVHKAKGLENDVVIVPDLARREIGFFGSSMFNADAVTLPDGRRALALRTIRLHNTAGGHRIEDERDHERAEDVRVLYVALTRARERLIVVAADPTGRAPWLDALAPWGYRRKDRHDDGEPLCDGQVRLRRIPPTRPHRETELLPVEGSPDAVAAFGRAWRRLRDATRPCFRHPSGVREQDEQRVERAVFAAGPARDVARLAGSVVHRALERWDGGGDDDLLRRAAELARAAAEQEGLADPAALAAEVDAIVRAFVQSELASRLRGLDIAGRELPMLHRREDGATWAGSVDLLYRETDGSYVVADYKTDREDDAEGLRRLYGEQLRIYAEAVRDALGLDQRPRTELWLLRSGIRLEL